MNTKRFECPSSDLRLGVALNKRRYVAWVSLFAAAALHAALTRFDVAPGLKTTAKPLTTQFVKRQPRLTKPLDLKKRPEPRRRRIERKMVAITARADRRATRHGLQTVQVMGSLARPGAAFYRTASFVSQRFEPHAVAAAIPQTKDMAQRMDMSLEMLDIQALDTGQYHAMVVQDPNDKRNIKGFFHLAAVYSANMNAELQMTRIKQIGVPNDAVWAMPQIVAAINKYTSIKADMMGFYTLDSEELFKIPWSYIAGHRPFKISVSEAHNLGEYLLSGGFLMADDDWACRYRSGDVSLRGMFKDALGAVGKPHGKVWSFEPLPQDHPVYHCYFDFSGLPMGNDLYSRQSGNNRLDVYDTIDGVTIHGRLVGIVSNKDYVEVWGRFGAWQGRGNDYTRVDQLAVNLVIFALTQEGSITYRVMASVTGY